MEFKINNVGDEGRLSQFKEKIEDTESIEIVCAGEEGEFFYEDSNESVDEGTPIGFDITIVDQRMDFLGSVKSEVELVLFKNIYWNPKYED